MIEPAAAAASTVQGEAVWIGPAVAVGSVIWTVRLKTGHAVTFLANGSKDFRAVALIASVAAVVEDLAVIALGAVEEDLVAIASVVVEALAAAALAVLADRVAVDFAVAGDDEN